MLIDRDDIRNNVTTIPLACFFSMFVYICDRFCFVLIGGNLTAYFTHINKDKLYLSMAKLTLS